MAQLSTKIKLYAAANGVASVDFSSDVMLQDDSDGNKIPNDQRMQYQHIKIIKDGATIPSEADVNAKIQELKDAEAAIANNKTSAQNKLKALGLTDAEIKAL